MSFDQEWAGHKAAAAEKQSTSMQLNQLPADGGGGSPQGDLQVNQQDLAAIGDDAFRLYQRLDRDGDHAKASSQRASSRLNSDFALAGAIGDVAEKWNDQVNTLLESCAHISNHLDYTQRAHAGDEYYIATSFSVSELSGGFDERTQR